jgi:hypothetical protein
MNPYEKQLLNHAQFALRFFRLLGPNVELVDEYECLQERLGDQSLVTLRR